MITPLPPKVVEQIRIADLLLHWRARNMHAHIGYKALAEQMTKAETNIKRICIALRLDDWFKISPPPDHILQHLLDWRLEETATSTKNTRHLRMSYSELITLLQNLDTRISNLEEKK